MVTAAVLPFSFLVGGAAVEGSLSPIIMFLSTVYYVSLFLAAPAGQDCSDLEEDKAFNIKTIGSVLTWRQNLLLFNLAVLIMIAGAVMSNKLFNMSYLTPILMAGVGIPMILYNMSISNLDITTGNRKFWPVAYAYFVLTPLILAVGAFF
jgi:4-hydroxybenzoate polyprenyltransferase